MQIGPVFEIVVYVVTADGSPYDVFVSKDKADIHAFNLVKRGFVVRVNKFSLDLNDLFL